MSFCVKYFISPNGVAVKIKSSTHLNDMFDRPEIYNQLDRGIVNYLFNNWTTNGDYGDGISLIVNRGWTFVTSDWWKANYLVIMTNTEKLSWERKIVSFATEYLTEYRKSGVKVLIYNTHDKKVWSGELDSLLSGGLFESIEIRENNHNTTGWWVKTGKDINIGFYEHADYARENFFITDPTNINHDYVNRYLVAAAKLGWIRIRDYGGWLSICIPHDHIDKSFLTIHEWMAVHSNEFPPTKLVFLDITPNSVELANRTPGWFYAKLGMEFKYGEMLDNPNKIFHKLY